jgi:hypothetical protein
MGNRFMDSIIEAAITPRKRDPAGSPRPASVIKRRLASAPANGEFIPAPG